MIRLQASRPISHPLNSVMTPTSPPLWTTISDKIEPFIDPAPVDEPLELEGTEACISGGRA